MKKLSSFLLIFVLIFSFTACGNGIGVVTPKYSSDVHSKEDIETAIRVATYYFIKEFDDCKLLTITYGGDDILENHKEFAPSGNIQDVIVLESSFYVGSSGGDGSLNPNDIYTGWKWIIVKDSDGNWVHKDHGYG